MSFSINCLILSLAFDGLVFDGLGKILPSVPTGNVLAYSSVTGPHPAANASFCFGVVFSCSAETPGIDGVCSEITIPRWYPNMYFILFNSSVSVCLTFFILLFFI